MTIIADTDCPRTFRAIAISRELAVKSYRESRDTAVKRGYSSAAEFDARVTRMVDECKELLGANRDQRPSRLAAFCNYAADVEQEATEAWAEAGADAYYTSIGNGAGCSEGRSLARRSACCPGGDHSEMSAEDGQLRREQAQAQAQWDEHHREGKYAELDAQDEADRAWLAGQYGV